MNGKKWALALTSILAAALLVAGCGSSTDKKSAGTSSKPIKIGATAGPHADVVHAVADEAKKQGLNVEVVEFSDYITPDKALAEGDLDLNSYQHAPFLANFNKQNGTKLVPIGNTILMRMGIYSNKIHDLKNNPELMKGDNNERTHNNNKRIRIQQNCKSRIKKRAFSTYGDAKGE